MSHVCMRNFFEFDRDILNSVVGGQSALGMKRLNITSLEQADAFLAAYGFDSTNPLDIEKIWYFHRRALVLLNEKLGVHIEDIPAELRDPRKLGDVRKLLIYASSADTENKVLQKFACSLLRVIHVYVHAETDLFSHFSGEIQNQILMPIERAVVLDGANHKSYMRDQNEQIPLVAFETKPFKTSSSTVIKLLAKSDAIAMKIYDKLGVRFVTENIFDSFRVIRFLTQKNLMSFPHIMPEQSSNTVFPIDLFVQTATELAQTQMIHEPEQIEEYFQKKLLEKVDTLQFVRKENIFSGDNYRFIKFIARKKIIIKNDHNPTAEPLSFFYPFEVQILDKSSHLLIQSGPSEHKEYKDRQKIAALKRIFPSDESDI